jgi:hypothetical protein
VRLRDLEVVAQLTDLDGKFVAEVLTDVRHRLAERLDQYFAFDSGIDACAH